MIFSGFLHNHHLTLKQSAQWLGYLGLIPFYVTGLLLLFNPDNDWALFSLQSYAAVILTFVGAIHWGRAIASRDKRLLVMSVMPSLVAWMGLLLPPIFGLPLLCVAFQLVWFFDQKQYKDLDWFKQLRSNLTTLVSAALLLSWVMILQRVL